MQGNINILPKKGPQTTFVNKRPITALNTAYKICAKAYQIQITSIAQRLFSTHQSGFLPGRSIHWTLMMTNEMVYHAKLKELNYILMKADVIKAYNSIEWAYLLAILKEANFPVFYLLC
jgi:retron-type reverse transcriptase